MTDKVQKIRKEVEKLQKRAEHNFDISLTENERQFWLGESNVLTLIGKYIDSLQEVPVTEVWHDASEKPIYKSYSKNGNQIAVYGKTSIGYGMSICSLIDNNTIYSPVAKKEYVWGDCPFTKWAYIDDLLNLDNSCNFGKNLQEEPVRGDFEMALAEMIDKAQKCVVEPWVVAAQWKDELVKLAKECKAMQEHPKDCMYSKDNYIDEDRKILCEGCEEDCKYNKKEEPASDGMEKELDRYIRDNFTIDMGQLDRFYIEPKDYMYSMDKSDMLAMARHFANWQKQQMVKAAIETEVVDDSFGQQVGEVPAIRYDVQPEDNLEIGDKVKLIIIKEG